MFLTVVISGLVFVVRPFVHLLRLVVSHDQVSVSPWISTILVYIDRFVQQRYCDRVTVTTCISHLQCVSKKHPVHF